MLTKTITFAVMHFSIAFTIAWLVTGSAIVGGLLALLEPACNTVAFYFHERAWALYNQRRAINEMNLATAKIPG